MLLQKYWEMELPETDLNLRQKFQEDKILKDFEFWTLY